MPAGKAAVEAVFQHIESSFRDVPANSCYRDAMEWTLENGVTSGMGGGLFGPDYACTRAQAACFLWRAAKMPAAESIANFADVAADAYYANAVSWEAQNGITAGTGKNTFSPDASCTRAHIVTFLYRTFVK